MLRNDEVGKLLHPAFNFPQVYTFSFAYPVKSLPGRILDLILEVTVVVVLLRLLEKILCGHDGVGRTVPARIEGARAVNRLGFDHPWRRIGENVKKFLEPRAGGRLLPRALTPQIQFRLIKVRN